MVKYNPKSWLQLIFGLHKSDTVRILWKEILYMAALSTVVAWVVLTYFPNENTLKNLLSVYSIIGFVISMLLVFRTNTAYDRWWEGRKKWGALVNDTRNLAAKIAGHTTNEQDREFFSRMIPNFCYAMKEHLREGVKWQELDFTGEEYNQIHKKEHTPLAIVHLMYARLKQMKSTGSITQEEYLSFDHNLNALLDSLGACERIRNTPIPYSYSIFLKKFIFTYTTTLPLAFVTLFGYFSAFITVYVFYVLVSIEVLAEEIEDPFGTDDNDLPTDSLCDKIKANVHETLLN